MIVVADTSPLNYLILIDEIELLQELFETIVVPQAVWNELKAKGSPQAVKDWMTAKPDWVVVRSALIIDESIKLGAGEVEAISLAKEISADLLLIDDRKARQVALEQKLNVAGTVNILESAFRRNLIDLKTAFQDLEQTNFRISSEILEKILEKYSNK